MGMFSFIEDAVRDIGGVVEDVGQSVAGLGSSAESAAREFGRQVDAEAHRGAPAAAARLFTAPTRAIHQFGKGGSLRERFDRAGEVAYDANPIAKNVGIRKEDALAAMRVAAVAAAMYFGYQGAAALLGSGAAAGGTTAAASGGAAAAGGAATAGTTAAAASTALTTLDYVQIAGTVLSGANLYETVTAKPPKAPEAPKLEDPFASSAPEQAAQRFKRRSSAEVGRFDTLLTGPLGLGDDTLGGSVYKKKTLLGS